MAASVLKPIWITCLLASASTPATVATCRLVEAFHPATVRVIGTTTCFAAAPMFVRASADVPAPVPPRAMGSVPSLMSPAAWLWVLAA